MKLRHLASRFPGHYAQWYAWCKFATDPLYGGVFDALKNTELPLLDIGCGMGLCSVYLRERGLSFPIYGIDFDTSKIAAALHAASGLDGLHFETRDARNGLPAHSGSVAILDILQYLDAAGQNALLREAANRVAPGGRLVIRTGIAAPGWRFALTRFTDRFAALCFWMKSAPVIFPTRDGIAATLQACGLRGEIRPFWGRTPFNNWIAVFQRDAAT